jgi:hypothetical protein
VSAIRRHADVPAADAEDPARRGKFEPSDPRRRAAFSYEITEGIMFVFAKFAGPAIVLAGVLSPFSAYPADLAALIDAHASFVNGGIGTEEADAIRTEAADYPLELVFSRRADERYEFVAEVHLRIQDRDGQVIVDKPFQGPIFLARLPDGTYTVTAEYRGETQKRRVAVVDGKHAKLSLVWS